MRKSAVMTKRAITLIDSMKGTGRIVRGLSGESEAHYSISVWRTSEGATFGHGEIAGTSEELVGLPRWPLPLILADGRRIDVTVVSERTGRNAAEVYVTHTEPSLATVAAAWPS